MFISGAVPPRSRSCKELAEEFDVPLYYDAAHAFGCRTDDRAIGGYGRARGFSFHASNVLSTGEGGCIATNDDVLAAKFVAMRGDEVAPAAFRCNRRPPACRKSRLPSG